MKKEDVAETLNGLLSEAGWQLERIAHLPRAFVRPSLVTPFFQARILRRPASIFLIDGYLGSIHRDFEAQWTSSEPQLKQTNSHCLALNVANVNSLRSKQYITGDAMNLRLSEFGSSIINELETLPHDEETLKYALERGKMMNRPIESFVVHAQAEKLISLRSFLVDRTRIKSTETPGQKMHFPLSSRSNGSNI